MSDVQKALDRGKPEPDDVCPRCHLTAKDHRHVYQTITFDPIGLVSGRYLTELVCPAADASRR